MALSIKYDDDLLAEMRDNHQALVQSISDLSDNIAKWQAEQTKAIQTGFNDLIRVLGGTGDEQLQNLIDQAAAALNLTSDEVEAAIKQSQTQKGENDNGS